MSDWTKNIRMQFHFEIVILKGFKTFSGWKTSIILKKQRTTHHCSRF